MLKIGMTKRQAPKIHVCMIFLRDMGCCIKYMITIQMNG